MSQTTGRAAGTGTRQAQATVPRATVSQGKDAHKTIWRMSNDLRGGVDGWGFKAYVLGLLFYRFISENLTAYLNQGERQAGEEEFDYHYLGNADAGIARITDRQSTLGAEIGVIVADLEGE
jgi:type I restriction enzyme M protein